MALFKPKKVTIAPGVTMIKKKYSDFEKRNFLFLYLLILIPVVQFAVFWFYVNLDSFALAFTDQNNGGFTLRYFKDVWIAFTEGDVGNRGGFKLSSVLGRSISLWGVANLIAFPIGIFATYILFKRVFGHYVFRVIFMLPGLIGSVVWTASVIQLADYNGPVVALLTKLGVELPRLVLDQGMFFHESTAFPFLLFITFIMGISGGSVVVTGALARIPQELFEVGILDGIGFWKEFFKVCLPCIWPTIAMTLTFGLCGIFTADGNVFLYSHGTGKPEMATTGFLLYKLVIDLRSGATTNYGYPAALGMCLTVMTLPVALGGRWLFEKICEPVEY